MEEESLIYERWLVSVRKSHGIGIRNTIFYLWSSCRTYDGSSDEIRQGGLSFLDERLFENVVGFENSYLQ